MAENQISLGGDLATIIKSYCLNRFLQHEQEGVTTSSYGVLISKDDDNIDTSLPIGMYIPKGNARREGKDAWVNEIFPGKAFEEDKKRGFCMDTDEQIELLSYLQEKKLKIAGIFHAHPEIPERYTGVSFTPTKFDIKSHYDEPGVWCMIVYLRKNNTSELHAFNIDKVNETYQEIPIQILEHKSITRRFQKDLMPGYYYSKTMRSHLIA